MVSHRLTQKLDEEKVFKDPVHRYVHVYDKLIWDLINTSEFQRLRRIRQLGTSYVTFHGAEHSRFNHSLGVYEVMRRILEKFMSRPAWSTEMPGWSEEDRLLCLCAALLHDVGHGPFSHSFEKVFDTDHEEWTRKILLGETQINQVLQQVSADFPHKVNEVIAKTYENKLVVSLISSQIDADRMDYLLRDAYYTGVNYGNFDLERILRVMRPHEEYAVIKYSGMHAVEDYIMSRYQMYWQVYFHPVTRSADVILRKIFKRVKDLYEQGYRFACPPRLLEGFLAGKIELKDYLRLDESTILYYFQMWQEEKDGILADLCDRFINRRLFKYVGFNPSSHMRLSLELEQLFKQAGIDPDYYLEFESSSDLPYDYYRPGEEGERLPIHLLMPDGELRELSQASHIVQSISGKAQTDHKIYFAQDLLEKKEKTYPAVVAKIKQALRDAEKSGVR
ncbi:metal dependent phosphohydrolase [Caldalkalibacillus thermarum TA2.A1]|uniref:HD domain-containing protein n=1 Tax=Caldalkalibacillus thermarum (strain TA2.A1) TaxID=986075 RepID=F5L474_CALTT|nr:HD domain-containing protein [Caldalkalibacillus thermarum]EGL83862.1 metal dependent phosphohydrolase [Caldalkalibacillus thermarum TA2.A1]QZT34216.1 HD domain-containing protein [Caldalkalibacillus thermarum TA2.A1]